MLLHNFQTSYFGGVQNVFVSVLGIHPSVGIPAFILPLLILQHEGW